MQQKRMCSIMMINGEKFTVAVECGGRNPRRKEDSKGEPGPHSFHIVVSVFESCSLRYRVTLACVNRMRLDLKDKCRMMKLGCLF